MIRDTALLESFEKSLSRRQHPDHRQNLHILESLYLEARSLGVFPLKNPLDGIEVDVRLAGVIHARRAT